MIFLFYFIFLFFALHKTKSKIQLPINYIIHSNLVIFLMYIVVMVSFNNIIHYFQVILAKAANVQTLRFLNHTPNIFYNFHVLVPKFHDLLRYIFWGHLQIHHFPKSKRDIYPKEHLLPYQLMYNNHNITFMSYFHKIDYLSIIIYFMILNFKSLLPNLYWKMFHVKHMLIFYICALFLKIQSMILQLKQL